MRRFAFYFLIGSLAFSAGVFSFQFLSHQEPELRPPYYDFRANNEPALYPIDSASDERARRNIQYSQKETNAKFTCRDKTILAVLDNIRRDDDLQNSLEFYLKEYPDDDCKDLFDVEDKDLNKDGIKESFVMAKVAELCGHGGNCPAWVVGQKAGKRKVILYNAQVEGIAVDKGYSEGYKNLSTYGEAGGAFHRLHLYRYQRDRYRVYKCFETTHDSQGDEHFRLLKLKEC